mgnify:CR=1 FL=1
MKCNTLFCGEPLRGESATTFCYIWMDDVLAGNTYLLHQAHDQLAKQITHSWGFLEDLPVPDSEGYWRMETIVRCG